MAKTCSAYVDGSYDPSTGYAGYGFCIIRHRIKIYEEHGSISDPHQSRNVTGEVTAAQRAVEWAIERNYTDLILYYDYTGIELWANGTWRSRTIVSDNYRVFIQQAIRNINIDFRKVKSHSGNEWNNYADFLARRSFL